MCTIFAQLVFHPKNRAQNRALFQKRLRFTKIVVWGQKRHLKITNSKKYTFLGVANWQLVKQVFGTGFWMLLGRQPPLKKPYFYCVFWKPMWNKKTNFLTALPKKKKYFWKMLNNKSELTKWATNTKQRNTNWHQNLSPKSSKTPIFVVRKWSLKRWYCS